MRLVFALCAFVVQGIQKFVSCSLVCNCLHMRAFHGAFIACVAMPLRAGVPLRQCPCCMWLRVHCTLILMRIDILPFSAMRGCNGCLGVFSSTTARKCIGSLRSIWEVTPNGVAPIRGVWKILPCLWHSWDQYLVLCSHSLLPPVCSFV